MDLSTKEGETTQPHYGQLTKEVLSFDSIQGFSRFNALCLIHQLEIDEPLSEEYYTKYTVKKQNGKNRILHEPKPVLMELQGQLLHFIYSIDDQFDPSIRNHKNNSYKLKACAVAYRPGVSVVRNANFHVGNDLVMKLDIKDFFGNVKTDKLIAFWASVLKLRVNYLIELGILDEKMSDDDRLITMTKLSKKLSYVTSLDGYLPQGSPTSGMLANYYMIRFDKFFLTYCIRNGLNYSRYSDDITVSGAKDKLRPQSVLGTINRLLTLEQLRLNKDKTRVLRKTQRQIVTGVVVNEKKSVPKSLKRELRQHVYFLKKFGEAHIAHKKTTVYKYLLKLKGQISWVLDVEKENAEFRKYFGELSIMLRFCMSKRNMEDAIQHILSVEQLTEKLKSLQHPVFGNVEWKKEDESCAHQSDTSSPGLISIHKRGIDRSLFTEQAMAAYFTQLTEGWRLPNTEDFKAYLEETHYEDRQLLGLRIPMDPQFNGFFNQTTKAAGFNKVAAYWTSNITHLPEMSQSNRRIGRHVFLVFPRKSAFRKALHQKFYKCTTSSGHVSVNDFLSLRVDSMDHESNFANSIFDYQPQRPTYSSAFSLRLVRTVNSNEHTTLNRISPEFWLSAAQSKYTTNMCNLGIENIPFGSLKEWKSSSILLGNNQLTDFELNGIAPVGRIDLSNNALKYFDVHVLPESVKHLFLHGNSNLSDLDLPINDLLPRLHEFTIDTPSIPKTDFSEMYERAMEIEWHHVNSDEEIELLIQNNVNIKALHVTVKIGSDAIQSEHFFERLNLISGLETLSILFEPNHEELKYRLDALKNAEVFEQENVLELRQFRDQNHVFDLLSKNYIFYPNQLQSHHIQSFIIDFSWLPNLVFHGNFSISPERYHLLHPGCSLSELPATSQNYHKPNILVKIIGEKLSQNSERLPDAQFQKLRMYYPLNTIVFYEETNTIFDLLPNEQIHVENLVLVCTHRTQRLVRRGQVSSVFPKSKGYRDVAARQRRSNKGKSIGFGSSRTFFNFPLLVFSLNYDVYKLSIPFRSMYRKVMDKNSELEKDLETGMLKKISLGNKFFSLFKSYKNFDLNDTRQLNKLSIFPVLKTGLPEPLKVNSPYVRKQFKVKANHYAKDLFIESLSREELLAALKNGAIDAVKLSRKHKKDSEIMLAAIQGNPFSYILAHPHLKQTPDFVLRALERSPRILVFLNHSIADESKRKNAVLPVVTDYMFQKFQAQDVYFMLNVLYRKIAYEPKGNFRFLNEESEGSNRSIIQSFEREIISSCFEERAGMRKRYFTYFMKWAIERKYFNANGFYISLSEVHGNPSDCVCLDLSYSKEKFALILPEMPNLKTLKISFSRYFDFSKLPVFPSCEALYMDGVDIYKLGDLAEFCVKFPKLKRFYFRCAPLLFKEQIKIMIEHCSDLEYLDLRQEKEEYLNLCSDLVNIMNDLGRTIELQEIE